ncbi:MAG: class II fumarate hydratase, partial [Candidatus Bipolaricaulia bacterium]
MAYRIETDSLGQVKVPQDAYYGPQTQRAVENFPVSDLRLQPKFIWAQGVIKKAAALANMDATRLDRKIGEAIVTAAEEVISGKFNDQFVVDVYQAGAGTSQNMNANEVIANRAIEILGGARGDYQLIHPNDHVNMAQSTNDTIHTAIHIAALAAIEPDLLDSLKGLADALSDKAEAFDPIIKSGRTHLQDATPIRLGQEFSGYASMIDHGITRVQVATDAIKELNIGGTAVGTGINADPEYARRMINYINEITGLDFRPVENAFEGMQNTDAIVELSGALRTVATSLIKIADDLRLLSSGPRTGLNEINLPAVQPGSSIMPGKVNPVVAEMMNMICYQVMGNDMTVVRAGQAGQLELNVMMPVIGYNILHAIKILTNGVQTFTERCIKGITANESVCEAYAERSLSIVTALSPHIGYLEAARLAKQALDEDRPIREVVLEETSLS